MSDMRISRVDVNPGQALFGAIDFHLSLKNGGLRRQVLDAFAEIHLRTNSQVRLARAYQTTPENAQEFGRNGEGHVMLTLDLTPAMLAELEERRSARPLDVEIRLTLVGVNLDTSEANGNVGFRVTTSTNYRIEKSRWVDDFLPSFGLGDYQMWEFRFPRQVTPEILKEETESLRRAIHDYNQGEYQDAFRDCRELVEQLKARKAELDLENVVGVEEWGRAENYLSTALHAKTGRTIVRADAEFAISLAQAIHRRVSHALANPKRSPPAVVSVKTKAN